MKDLNDLLDPKKFSSLFDMVQVLNKKACGQPVPENDPAEMAESVTPYINEGHNVD